MGTVINFPDERAALGERLGDRGESATIIILPVVRIERSSSDEPSGGLEPGTSSSPGRKRRRRGSRS